MEVDVGAGMSLSEFLGGSHTEHVDPEAANKIFKLMGKAKIDPKELEAALVRVDPQSKGGLVAFLTAAAELDIDPADPRVATAMNVSIEGALRMAVASKPEEFKRGLDDVRTQIEGMRMSGWNDGQVNRLDDALKRIGPQFQAQRR